MTTKKLSFVISAGVLLIGAAALYWQLNYWELVPDLESMSNEKIWTGLSCRARLYLQKARGGVSELSWTELWGLTFPGRGFHCTEGASLEASLLL